jgi:hypothetical protein
MTIEEHFECRLKLEWYRIRLTLSSGGIGCPDFGVDPSALRSEHTPKRVAGRPVCPIPYLAAGALRNIKSGRTVEA